MVWDKQKGPVTNSVTPTKTKLTSQQSTVAKAAFSGSEKWFIVRLLIFELLWAAALTLLPAAFSCIQQAGTSAKKYPLHTLMTVHCSSVVQRPSWVTEPSKNTEPEVLKPNCCTEFKRTSLKSLQVRQPWVRRPPLTLERAASVPLYLCYSWHSCTELFSLISPYPGVNRDAPLPTSCSNVSGQRSHCTTLL